MVFIEVELKQSNSSIENDWTFNEMFGKASTLLDSFTLLLKEYVAVKDVQHRFWLTNCLRSSSVLLICPFECGLKKKLQIFNPLEIVHNQNDSTYVDSKVKSDNGIKDVLPIPSSSEMQ